MDPIDLLVVGPGGRETGGIARYVAEQRRRLPEDVSVRVFDDATPTGQGPTWLARAALSSLVDAVRFPFRRRPDVVHVHTSDGASFYRASWYVLVATLVWDRPVVVHVHGSGFEEFVAREGPAGRLQSAVFDAADRVIALSNHWFRVLSDRVPESKLVVVPNAVDPDGYDPEFGGDPPEVVFVSHHIERKGIGELVEALDRLDDSDLRFRATIAGDGALSDRAAALAERSEHVDYVGYVPEERKRSILDRADVYALPTHAEGLPIALLEGMAAGNAVVTTGVGAIPEVIDHQTGRIVPPGDVDALAEALEELLGDPDLAAAMGRRNRARVLREYSWSSATDRLVATYRSMTDDRDATGPRADGG